MCISQINTLSPKLILVSVTKVTEQCPRTMVLWVWKITPAWKWSVMECSDCVYCCHAKMSLDMTSINYFFA